MLSFYLKSSVRGIARKKVFSALSIAGLSIGICVFLLALEYFSFEKGFNRFHKNIASLYRVNIASQGGKSASTFPTIAPMMQSGIPGVSNAVRFADNFSYGSILSYQSPGATAIKSFRQDDCVFVDASFTDVFSFPFIAGHAQLDKTNTAVITEGLAKKFFGDDYLSAVGKTLQLHNQFGLLPITITGILKDIPTQSDIKFSCLLPISTLDNPAYTADAGWAKLNNWDNDSYTTYVKLDGNANTNIVAQKASALWRLKDPDYKKQDGSIQLQPVADMHLGASINDDNPTYNSMAMVYFIMALGALVLCIAWINYINFSTAYAISQAKQIGIHKIVGSSKRQIVLRYIYEAGLLNLFGLVLAFCLSKLLQNFFNYLTGRPLSLVYINNPLVWVFSAAGLIAGVLLCGGYAGIILAKFKPAAIMRFNNAGNTGSLLLRRGLVIFQFSISAIFITSTIIAYRQINFMRNHNLGMNINNLVVISGPSIRDSTFKTNKTIFVNRLQQFAFVKKFSASGSVPGIGSGHNFSADGLTGTNAQKGDEKKSYSVSEIDEHYFDTYEIPFVSGNNFTQQQATLNYKGNAVIVNETAARMLGYSPETATRHIINWDKVYTIAGVVKDYHHSSLKEKIEPIIYIPMHSNACYTIKVDFDNLQQKMASVRDIYQQLYLGNPFEYKILKDSYDGFYANEQKSGLIALSISVLVIVIASLGLAGLAMFTAKRRNKEMGIRKVLGASSESLFVLMSKEFLWLVAIAFIIAAPLTWFGMQKWLQAFAYRIDIPWWAFAIAALSTLFIALATISFQAIKTAIANPAIALKSE